MVMPVVLMTPMLLLAHKPIYSGKIHKLCLTKQERKGSVNFFYTASDGSKKIKESRFYFVIYFYTNSFARFFLSGSISHLKLYIVPCNV